MGVPPARLSQGDELRPISLQELKLQAEGRHWRIDQALSALDSLTPVRGALTAVHRGNALELEGEASTIVTLCCDRCLQHFNHPLSFRTREALPDNLQAILDQQLAAEAKTVTATVSGSSRLPFEPKGKK